MKFPQRVLGCITRRSRLWTCPFLTMFFDAEMYGGEGGVKSIEMTVCWRLLDVCSATSLRILDFISSKSLSCAPERHGSVILFRLRHEANIWSRRLDYYRFCVASRAGASRQAVRLDFYTAMRQRRPYGFMTVITEILHHFRLFQNHSTRNTRNSTHGTGNRDSSILLRVTDYASQVKGV